MDTKDEKASASTAAISDEYLTNLNCLDIENIYLQPIIMSKKKDNQCSNSYALLEPYTVTQPNVYVVMKPEEESAYAEPQEISREEKQTTICDLIGKALTEVPMEVVKNENIRTLILDQNRFGVFPSAIYDMVHLQVISAAAQMEPKPSRRLLPALHHIPPGIDRLKELSWLLLYNNALVNLPESFFNLKNLQHLDLRLNLLADFPQCLCSMPRVVELHLSGNKISRIPREISHMSSLEVLTMAQNEVTDIPEELCELKKLNYLSMENNRISKLPQNLVKLNGLLPNAAETEQNRRLFVAGNPLIHPPKDHISTTHDIFEFLRKFQSRQGHEKQQGSKRKTGFHIPSAEVAATQASLEEYLTSNGLVCRNTVPGNGDGFFYALADQLTRHTMDLQRFTHTELREHVVDYLRETTKEVQRQSYLQKEQQQEVPNFSSWLQTTKKTTLDAYVSRLSEDGAWADEVAMKAAALMLCRDICVITTESYELASLEESPGTSLSSVWCNRFTGGQGKIIHIAYVNANFQSLGLPDEERPYDDTDVQVAVTSERKTTEDLSQKGLQKLPPSVTNESSIQRLILSRNHLTDSSWWMDLKSLPGVQSLDIREQRPKDESRLYRWLTEIPTNIHFYCQNLRELVMSNNRIQSLPCEISFIKSLQLLDFIDNQITEVPAQLCDLPNLQYLGMSNNRLAHIPENIGHLTTLVVLRLSHNRLVKLPESVCELRHLQVLSLSSNRLLMLPLQLHKLKNLMSGKIYKNSNLPNTVFHAGLRIEGNEDIKYPTHDICQQGTKSMFEYLEHMDNRPDKRAALISIIRSDASSTESVVRPRSTTWPFKHLTDKFLDNLSSKLGREWRSLGISLDLHHKQLDIFEDDYPHQTKQAISKMLHVWRDTSCGQMNEEKMLKKLLNAFVEVGREDLKQMLDEEYKCIS